MRERKGEKGRERKKERLKEILTKSSRVVVRLNLLSELTQREREEKEEVIVVGELNLQFSPRRCRFESDFDVDGAFPFLRRRGRRLQTDEKRLGEEALRGGHGVTAAGVSSIRRRPPRPASQLSHDGASISRHHVYLT